MKSLFYLSCLLPALLLSAPAVAQTALDRTDPTQEEEEDRQNEEAERLPENIPDAAPPIQQDQAPTTGQYEVGAIIVDGADAIPVSAFADIVARYNARTLSSEQLASLANEVAARARSLGYIFATAVIQPQSLNAGVLRVSLDEGVVDEIRVSGDDDAAIRSQLAPLANGSPVTLAMLERQILLAGDVSGVYIRDARFEREGEQGILLVEASRQRVTGAIEFENDGSRPVGPERVRADVDFNGFFSPFDEVDLSYATTPFEPEELQYGSARYRTVVSSQGTEIGARASYSATDPGAYLADRDVFGRSWRIGVHARHPIVRSRTFSLWGQVEAEMRDLRQERFGELARHDRIPVLRAELYTLADLFDGRLRSRVTLSRGIDILGATELGDPLASRDDASAKFTSLYGWFDWDRDISSDVSIEIAGRGQLAADPLLSTEDLGLGGNSFLRGYNYSERSGDNGIMGSGELRYDWGKPLGLLREIQIYAYADGGVVGNLDDGRGSGSLASAGGGFRTEITRDLDLDFEVGIPLTGPRYDTDDKSPRLNLRIRYTL